MSGEPAGIPDRWESIAYAARAVAEAELEARLAWSLIPDPVRPPGRLASDRALRALITKHATRDEARRSHAAAADARARHARGRLDRLLRDLRDSHEADVERQRRESTVAAARIAQLTDELREARGQA